MKNLGTIHSDHSSMLQHLILCTNCSGNQWKERSWRRQLRSATDWLTGSHHQGLVQAPVPLSPQFSVSLLLLSPYLILFRVMSALKILHSDCSSRLPVSPLQTLGTVASANVMSVIPKSELAFLSPTLLRCPSQNIIPNPVETMLIPSRRVYPPL